MLYVLPCAIRKIVREQLDGVTKTYFIQGEVCHGVCVFEVEIERQYRDSTDTVRTVILINAERSCRGLSQHSLTE
jgi:hypothetical protein